MDDLVLIASYTYEQKPMVENTLRLLNLVKNKDYFYDLIEVFPNGFNLHVKVEFSELASASLFNAEQNG